MKKLLLTSAGISKRAIAEALAELTGKSPADTKIGFVTTAANVEEGNKDWFIDQFLNLWRFGFNWIDIVDPSATNVPWESRLSEVDVVLVSGGNTFHLLDQCRKTGFDKWLENNLDQKVYVGISAGTIVACPNIEIASTPNLPNLTDLSGFGWVDFEIKPHFDIKRFRAVEKYAKQRPDAVYAIDDQTAIKVVDTEVEVISEGSWQLFQ